MRLSIPLRMTIGLVLVTMSTILIANVMGILQDPNELRIRRRIAICESLAINCSLLARENDIRKISTNVEMLAERNQDIRSAALRRNTGEIIYKYGDHAKHWRHGKQVKGKKPDRDNILVPILSRQRVWGSVEVAFGNSAEPWQEYFQINRFPILALTLFCGLLNSAAIYWYLRRTLSYLDPSQSVPDRVRTALDTLAEGLVVLDAEGRIVLANKTFAERLGKQPLELQGESVDDLPWWQIDNGSNAEMPWSITSRTMEKLMGSKLGLKTSEGDRIYLVNTSPIYDGSGESRGILASFDDITELEGKQLAMQSMLGELRRSRTQIQERNRELRLLATRDPLTGCLNRRTFFESFDRQWAQSERNRRPLSCLMMDIDFFKSINDDHGHMVGDRVLQKVAKTIQNTCRQSDLLCRYGGEEFCIVMPDTELEACEIFANRVRQRVEATDMGIEGLNVTISLGASCSDLGASDPQSLLDQADKALYIAKRTGRNRVCRWDDVPENGEVEKVSLPRHAPAAEEQEDSDLPYRAVTSLISALGARDPETAAHSTRVAELCVSVARGLMSLREAYLLEIAALLHDIGKIGVPDSVLLKPGPLTQEEWQVMKIHDRIGVDIVEASLQNKTIVELIRFHRLPYRTDRPTPGFPQMDDIPLAARILSIADAYDSMVTSRAYREGLSQEQAFEELQRCAGSQFDPRLVERFIAVVEDFDYAQSVTVNSKHAAIKFGLQMEHLATAIDAENVAQVREIAERLKLDAGASGVQVIEQKCEKLLDATAQSELDLHEIAVVTRDLMDLCRSAQACHIHVNRDYENALAP